MSVQGTHLTVIADAIREKEGTALPIPADAFAERILALPFGEEATEEVLPAAPGIAEQLARTAEEIQEAQLSRISAAIRAKEGSSGTIPASQFAARILALPERKASRLPEGYTEVEYIDIHGNAGFSLGMTINPATFRMVLDLSVYPNEKSGEYLLICNKNGEQKTWIYRKSASSVGYMLRLASSDAFVSVSFPENKRTILDLNWQEKTFTVDGITKPLENVSYTTGTAFLFYSTTGGGGWPALPCKLYAAQIYKSGVLQKELVPCVQESTGLAGLYDMNSNLFRTKGSANTGTITAGPAV